MKDKIKLIILLVGMISSIIFIPYCGWKISRWWKYKWSYQGQVQKEIQKEIKPLVIKINDLEKRVEELENGS